MTRIALRATVAFALALSASACQTTLPSGSISAGDLSAAAATAPPATVSKLQAQVAAVQKYARVVCGVVPTVESIANIFAASNESVATAKQIADVACAALAKPSTYSADLPTRARAKASAPVGSTVTGVAVVNGTPVRVTGKVVR